MKPVRDSMMEALHLWKKVSGKGESNASEESVGIKSYTHYLFICIDFLGCVSNFLNMYLFLRYML